MPSSGGDETGSGESSGPPSGESSDPGAEDESDQDAAENSGAVPVTQPADEGSASGGDEGESSDPPSSEGGSSGAENENSPPLAPDSSGADPPSAGENSYADDSQATGGAKEPEATSGGEQENSGGSGGAEADAQRQAAKTDSGEGEKTDKSSRKKSADDGPKLRADDAPKAPTAKDEDREPSKEPAGDRHTVESGDSLWAIAERVYDTDSDAETARAVNRLWELNDERIRSGDRDLIQPGQELRTK